MNNTTRGSRLHIGIFGRTNSGKSSLINNLTGHRVSLVSEKEGTTTDAVYKSMELHPLGPVVFIDTAGFADDTQLGKERMSITDEVLKKTDVAILLFDDENFEEERRWIEKFENAKIPFISVISKADILDRKILWGKIKSELSLDSIIFNEKEAQKDRRKIVEAIEALIPEDFYRRNILGSLVSPGDLVLLVMPQDIQAPKGRLILPQVQTIRELLDTKCTVVSTTLDNLRQSLDYMSVDPSLVITDSQCFKAVKEGISKNSKLTSFSVLFAAFKGDIEVFIESAKKIDELDENSKVLIAEACTHAPLEEDIGRVKIPALLRKRFGQNMQIDVVSGSDWKDVLEDYDLIIHCGACMFNRKHMMSRVEDAKDKAVPITNYGITIAHLQGILEDVVY